MALLLLFIKENALNCFLLLPTYGSPNCWQLKSCLEDFCLQRKTLQKETVKNGSVSTNFLVFVFFDSCARLFRTSACDSKRYEKISPSWWFQPLFQNMNMSHIGSFPQVGVKKKCLKQPPKHPWVLIQWGLIGWRRKCDHLSWWSLVEFNCSVRVHRKHAHIVCLRKWSPLHTLALLLGD